MSATLKDCKVAILVADGFEQSELIKPREALQQAGAVTEVVSPAKERVRGWQHTDWGSEVEVDRPLARASAGDYDALLLPGGVLNPDSLRMDSAAVEFVHDFHQAGKPIAAICHGPWTLIDAGAVKGRKITSWPSLRADLRNAGAEWVDEEVVADRGLVSSRKPDDIPAFNDKMIEEFAEGVHQERATA